MPRYCLALGVAALFVVCTTAHAELGEGSSGPEVRALQRALNLYGSHLEVEGVFEKETRRAVRRFQRQHDLDVTGVVNGATLERLMQPLKLGDTGSEVRRLQRILNAPITGTFRTSTEEVVKRFQREHELEPTGEFSPRLLGLLDNDPESAVAPEADLAQGEDDATTTQAATGAGAAGSTPGLDELGEGTSGSSSESAGSSSDSSTTSKAGDALKDLFSSMTKGGGQFANGQGTASSAKSGGTSGKPLGGGAISRPDPLASVKNGSTVGNQGGTQAGTSGTQAGTGGTQAGTSGTQAGTGGTQAGQGSQASGQGAQGSQSAQSGQGDQSSQGEDSAFTSKELPLKVFKSLAELGSALEVLKVIEDIQQKLAQGTIEEALVQAMNSMKSKAKSADAKALIDLAIKVYEIPSPDGKKKYIQPALVAVLKAKAVEIGAVGQGPGAAASAVAKAAYDKLVAARFPGLK
ncbi:MAG: peptidoglycan-binding protein [Planctomycetes bacterium]|nr:peptidoglycan-binding protein [Planctomycetota bacterium]